jgi:hypothetical protein
MSHGNFDNINILNRLAQLSTPHHFSCFAAKILGGLNSSKILIIPSFPKKRWNFWDLCWTGTEFRRIPGFSIEEVVFESERLKDLRMRDGLYYSGNGISTHTRTS